MIEFQKFSSDGKFITKWGSIGINSDQFASPRGIAIDPHDNVYIADTKNNRIQKFIPVKNNFWKELFDSIL